MGRYIVQRILLVLPNLVLVTLFVFFLLRLVPGDIAADVLGPAPPPMSSMPSLGKSTDSISQFMSSMRTGL